MPQVTTNKDDWSGEEVTVKYSETAIFELYGYTFTLGAFKEFESTVFDGEGLRELYGDQWDAPLTLLHLSNDSLESAIIAAIKWVSNHV